MHSFVDVYETNEQPRKVYTIHPLTSLLGPKKTMSHCFVVSWLESAAHRGRYVYSVVAHVHARSTQFDRSTRTGGLGSTHTIPGPYTLRCIATDQSRTIFRSYMNAVVRLPPDPRTHHEHKRTYGLAIRAPGSQTPFGQFHVHKEGYSCIYYLLLHSSLMLGRSNEGK